MTNATIDDDLAFFVKNHNVPLLVVKIAKHTTFGHPGATSTCIDTELLLLLFTLSGAWWRVWWAIPLVPLVQRAERD